jgi:hypothetical protein
LAAGTGRSEGCLVFPASFFYFPGRGEIIPLIEFSSMESGIVIRMSFVWYAGMIVSPSGIPTSGSEMIA